ncbi:MAG: DsbA family protein, partial [Armatimonadetes bacterium]|nr:DsbA family protein [Armatimonadota bacterium]
LSVWSARRPTPPAPPPVAESGPWKGSASAPVTVVEYADFQCAHCGEFSRETFRDLERAYIATGKVRWNFRHSAILGPESQWAALASECAAEQGRFWAYHDVLMNRQAGVNRGGFHPDRLARFAEELRLDVPRFRQCFESGRYLTKVREETEEAQRRGVRGTPSFFVGDTFIEGNQPVAVFRQAIEDRLKER